MLKNLLFLIGILNSNQKKNLFFLQILIIICSFFETISILSIAPFVALIADHQNIDNQSIKKIYHLLGYQNHEEFLAWFGIVIVLFFFLTTCLNIVTNYGLIKFSQNLSVHFTGNLFRKYLNKNLLFYSNKNSNDLISKIILETSRITGGTIQATMFLISKLFFVVFISLSLIIFEPVISILSFLIIFILYYALNFFIHKRLMRHGENVTLQNKDRINSINQGFQNIKEVIFYKKSDLFIDLFIKSAKSLAKSQIFISTLSTVPIFIFQFTLIGSLVIAIIFLTQFEKNSFDLVISTLSVFALAGLRLIPAMNSIYTSFTQIKSNQPAFDNLKFDLFDLDQESNKIKFKKKSIKPSKLIIFKNLYFKYPNSKDYVLDNFSAQIKVGNLIGVKGKTGSGKTTFIDILLGLIDMNKGQIIIDGKIFNSKKNYIGDIAYVPQQASIFDTSILNNITFFSPEEKFDQNKFDISVKISALDIFINNFKDKHNYVVGERGVKLSGGQKQRIGIARGIYQNPKILVLDESTNALDYKTENIVLTNLKEYASKNKLTVIFVTHSKKILKYCDQIIDIDHAKKK